MVGKARITTHSGEQQSHEAAILGIVIHNEDLEVSIAWEGSCRVWEGVALAHRGLCLAQGMPVGMGSGGRMEFAHEAIGKEVILKLQIMG